MTPEQQATMFSSATDMWATPQDFFDKLNVVFQFGTDVCAKQENAKCAVFYTPEQQRDAAIDAAMKGDSHAE